MQREIKNFKLLNYAIFLETQTYKVYNNYEKMGIKIF